MADIQQLSTARSVAEREVARTLRREKINATVRYVILLVVGLLMLYPLVWMFFRKRLENRHRVQLRPLHAEHL